MFGQNIHLAGISNQENVPEQALKFDTIYTHPHYNRPALLNLNDVYTHPHYNSTIRPNLNAVYIHPRYSVYIHRHYNPTAAYAYVFPYDLPIPPLRELDDEALFSKLHTKLWNQSIDDEESTWAGAHGTLPETDECDIVRGCFTLEVNIPNFRISKLWVRKEYIRFYDQCNSHYENFDRKQDLSPCAIITGQPGIGERFSS